MSAAILEVRSLAAGYGKKQIVHGIDLRSAAAKSCWCWAITAPVRPHSCAPSSAC